MRFVTLSLALSLATVVAAAPAVASSFESDGSRYEYNRIDKPDGVVLIDGRAIDSGSIFSLRVIDDQVTGTLDGKPIAFTISKATMAALANERPNAIASK